MEKSHRKDVKESNVEQTAAAASVAKVKPIAAEQQQQKDTAGHQQDIVTPFSSTFSKPKK